MLLLIFPKQTLSVITNSSYEEQVPNVLDSKPIFAVRNDRDVLKSENK